jgi:hypothetical protein
MLHKIFKKLKIIVTRKDYRFTYKYSIGSEWDAEERKIYLDKKGKFIIYNSKRIYL